MQLTNSVWFRPWKNNPYFIFQVQMPVIIHDKKVLRSVRPSKDSAGHHNMNKKRNKEKHFIEQPK